MWGADSVHPQPQGSPRVVALGDSTIQMGRFPVAEEVMLPSFGLMETLAVLPRARISTLSVGYGDHKVHVVPRGEFAWR